MSQLNVSVLATAKETYTYQMKNNLTPIIYEGFVSLYEDAKIKENDKPEFNYNYLKQFQTLLKDIPHWNQSILEEETRRILNKFDYFLQLIAAIFVSYIKILASIRLKGDASNIRIRLPTPEIFIHKVYIKAAEYIYYNPRSFTYYHLWENQMYIYDLINKSIEDTINSMIPYGYLLKEYLSNAFNENIKKEEYTEKPVEETPFSTILNSKDLEQTTNGSDISSQASEINNDFVAGNNGFKDDDLLNTDYSAGIDPFDKKDAENKDMLNSNFTNTGSADPFSSGDLNSEFTGDLDKTKDNTDILSSKEQTESFGINNMDDIFGKNDNQNTDIFNTEAPLPPELNKNDDIFYSNDNSSIKFKEDLL